MTPTQLGKTIGAALQASGSDAIAKTLLKQLDIGKLTKTIDSLAQSASSFGSAVKSISNGGATGATDTKSKVSDLNTLTAATKNADDSMAALKESLEATAGEDDNSAMSLAIESFKTMIETNESLQEQIEQTKTVYDLLGKIVELSSKKSANATVSSATKQVAANTTATASNGAKAVSGATANSMMFPPPFNIIALGAGIAAILGALAMIVGGPKSAGVSGGKPSAATPSPPSSSPSAAPAASPEKAVEKKKKEGNEEAEKDKREEAASVTTVKENTTAVRTLTTSIIKQGAPKEEAEPASTTEPSESIEPTETVQPEAAKPTERDEPERGKKEEGKKEEGEKKQGSIAQAISKLANFNPGKSLQNAILSPMKAIAAPFHGMKDAVGELKSLKLSDIKQRLNPFTGFKEAFRTQVLGKPPSEQKKTAEAGAAPAAKPAEKAAPAETSSVAEKASPEASEKKETPKAETTPAEAPGTPVAAPTEPAAAKTASAAVPTAPKEAPAEVSTLPPPIDGKAARRESEIESAALKSATEARKTAESAEQKLHDAKMGMLTEEKESQTELMDQIRADTEERASIFEQEQARRDSEFEDKKTKNKGILGFLQAEGKMDEWKTKLTIKNHAKELASSAKKFAMDTARTAKGLVVKAASAAANVVKWAFALPFPLNIVALAAGGAAVVGGVLWARSMMKGGGGAAPKVQDPGEAKEEDSGPSGGSPTPEDVEGKGDKNAAKSMGSLSVIGMTMLVYERQKKEVFAQMLSLMRSIDKKLDNVGGGDGVNIINQEAPQQAAGDDKATNPSDPFKAFRYAFNLTRSV